jgi:crotonobetainyl-CoA:carnitine CoA-transferase CaiB-like acyl-CoA transferase
MMLADMGADLLAQGAKQDPARQRAFKHSLEDLFRTKTLKEWQSIFADKDACVEPVLKFSEACQHEQIRERGMVVSVPLSNGSTVEQIAHPIKMSRSEPMYRHVGVKLGEHNDEILEEIGSCVEGRDAISATRAMG